MINKIVNTFDEAVSGIKEGAKLLIASFGGPAECPSYLIAALARTGIKNLTVVSNSGGWGTEFMEAIRTRMSSVLTFPPDFYDLGLLVERGQLTKGILAVPAAIGRIHTPFEKKVMNGEVELELVGQGTIAEGIRAARAGIAAFYTPTGVGTFVAEGKEVREFDGRKYLLEHAIKGDASLIRAHKADRYGNLTYRGSARTFNATMAGASTVTIAEVDEVVELGELDPEQIVTPGIYVQRVVVRPREPRPWDKPM
ncbi:MAG TPA: 3-oxoacid CoA-transferase subunit A [Candidatus Binataceae bacterium]|nr:3-oxoacid CoA-transferase subunit A [Candidatus Binataceae bacterium]